MLGFVVVLGVLVLLANLPFIASRFMGLVSLRAPKAGLGLFVEVLLCYSLSLLGLSFFESQLEGVSYSQGWEFYVVLSCLFVVAGFPGFVHHFFWRTPAAG